MTTSKSCEKSVCAGMSDGLLFPKKIIVSSDFNGAKMLTYYAANFNHGRPLNTDAFTQRCSDFFSTTTERGRRHRNKLDENYGTGLEYVKWIYSSMKEHSRDGRSVVRTFGGHLALGTKFPAYSVKSLITDFTVLFFSNLKQAHHAYISSTYRSLEVSTTRQASTPHEETFVGDTDLFVPHIRETGGQLCDFV